MKITKQQIELIANAMVKEIYDPNKIREETNKAVEPYVREFKKSKIYKLAEDAFKNPLVERIAVSRETFETLLPEELKKNIISDHYYYCEKYFSSTLELVNSFRNRCVDLYPKKVVNFEALMQKIVLELTLKSLGADDIYEVLEDIKASMKKEFNL